MNLSNLDVRKQLPLDCGLLCRRYQKGGGGGGSLRGQAVVVVCVWGWGVGGMVVSLAFGQLLQPLLQRGQSLDPASSSNLVQKCLKQAAVPVPSGLP